MGCSCSKAGSEEPVLLLCLVTVLFVLPVKGTVVAQALERVQEGFFHSQSVSSKNAALCSLVAELRGCGTHCPLTKFHRCHSGSFLSVAK